MNKIFLQASSDYLELARAREIWITFCLNKNRDNMIKLVNGSAKAYGKDSIPRIKAYLRQFKDGEIE
jgi:hypothetical protein